MDSGTIEIFTILFGLLFAIGGIWVIVEREYAFYREPNHLVQGKYAILLGMIWLVSGVSTVIATLMHLADINSILPTGTIPIALAHIFSFVFVTDPDAKESKKTQFRKRRKSGK